MIKYITVRIQARFKRLNNSLLRSRGLFAFVLQRLFSIRILGTNLSLKEYYTFYSPDWYHNFKVLGKKTYQLKHDGHIEAQLDKQDIIFKLIKKGISKYSDEIKGVELFCADGFYSNFAVQAGIKHMTGIDLAEKSGEGGKRSSVLDQGRLISKLLNNQDNIDFVNDNVYNLNKKYNLCLCFGGLYHINDPIKLLDIIKANINGVLVIQTVVSLENEDENYFESPAPGWTWGCRFSHAFLKKTLLEKGWKIIEEERNEITWNIRKCDRGSSYFLCISE